MVVCLYFYNYARMCIPAYGVHFLVACRRFLISRHLGFAYTATCAFAHTIRRIIYLYNAFSHFSTIFSIFLQLCDVYFLMMFVFAIRNAFKPLHCQRFVALLVAFRRLWSKWIPTYEKFGAQEFHNLIVVTAAPAAVAESTAVSLYAYIHTYKHSSTLLTAFAICLPSFTFFICSLQLLLNSRFCGIFLWNLYAYVRKISKAASRRRWRRVRASAMNADLLAGSSCVANVTLKLGIKWQNELHQLQKRQQQQKHYKV